MLSGATLAVFDKTGTLTVGKPSVKNIVALDGFTERDVLLNAAAVEQGSGHLLARVVVEEGEKRYTTLPEARHHHESPGEGVTGVVGEIEIVVGSRAFVARHAITSLAVFNVATNGDAGLRAYVLLCGKPAGIIVYADSLRPELESFLTGLSKLNLTRTVLLSGDSSANASAVGLASGMKEIHGDLLPVDKATMIARFRAHGDVVMMVGDGTNNAPALSTADVGVALAGHGGGVTSEAADVVILVDDLAKVAEAVAISRRTMRLARQSITAGLALSGIAMGFAAFGFIQPMEGALLQEAIDVGVILNALRASWS